MRASHSMEGLDHVSGHLVEQPQGGVMGMVRTFGNGLGTPSPLLGLRVWLIVLVETTRGDHGPEAPVWSREVGTVAPLFEIPNGKLFFKVEEGEGKRRRRRGTATML